MDWMQRFSSTDKRSISRSLCLFTFIVMVHIGSTTSLNSDSRDANLERFLAEPYVEQKSYFGSRDFQVLRGPGGPSYLSSQGHEWRKDTPTEELRGPYFVVSGIKRNVTTTFGQTAYLHCHVADLGDLAQVSWIRKRDLHVLSSGVVVFASDQRFQVLHPPKSDKWTLQIKFAQIRDAGVYECQVNTEPKISISYFLNVVEPRARIVGPVYVKTGSTINLTCIINQPPTQSLIYWYHNREILDYEGSVSINTRGDEERTTSLLTITKASSRHSGNYTC